eukprot:403348050
MLSNSIQSSPLYNHANHFQQNNDFDPLAELMENQSLQKSNLEDSIDQKVPNLVIITQESDNEEQIDIQQQNGWYNTKLQPDFISNNPSQNNLIPFNQKQPHPNNKNDRLISQHNQTQEQEGAFKHMKNFYANSQSKSDKKEVNIYKVQQSISRLSYESKSSQKNNNLSNIHQHQTHFGQQSSQQQNENMSQERVDRIKTIRSRAKYHMHRNGIQIQNTYRQEMDQGNTIERDQFDKINQSLDQIKQNRKRQNKTVLQEDKDEQDQYMSQDTAQFESPRQVYQQIQLTSNNYTSFNFNSQSKQKLNQGQTKINNLTQEESLATQGWNGNNSTQFLPIFKQPYKKSRQSKYLCIPECVKKQHYLKHNYTRKRIFTLNTKKLVFLYTWLPKIRRSKQHAKNLQAQKYKRLAKILQIKQQKLQIKQQQQKEFTISCEKLKLSLV